MMHGQQNIKLEEQCVAWNVNKATFKQNERAERKAFLPTVV
jgi:hypothetical protein